MLMDFVHSFKSTTSRPVKNSSAVRIPNLCTYYNRHIVNYYRRQQLRPFCAYDTYVFSQRRHDILSNGVNNAKTGGSQSSTVLYCCSDCNYTFNNKRSFHAQKAKRIRALYRFVKLNDHGRQITTCRVCVCVCVSESSSKLGEERREAEGDDQIEDE